MAWMSAEFDSPWVHQRKCGKLTGSIPVESTNRNPLWGFYVKIIHMIDLPKVLATGKWLPEQIDVVHSLSNRKINSDWEAKCEAEWLRKVEDAKITGKKAWDSVTYRLNDLKVENNRVHLDFGTIPFRIRNTFPSIVEGQEVEEECFPKGIFVAGLIQTTDDLFVFGKLSGKTLVKRKIDFIGGTLVKDELIVNNGSDLIIALEAELLEEINVSPEHVASYQLISIVLSDRFNVGLIYHVQLKVSSETVLESFQKANDQEMSDVVFVEKKDLYNFASDIPGFGKAVVQSLSQSQDLGL